MPAGACCKAERRILSRLAHHDHFLPDAVKHALLSVSGMHNRDPCAMAAAHCCQSRGSGLMPAVCKHLLHVQVAFDLNLGNAGDLQQLQLTLQQAAGFGPLQVRCAAWRQQRSIATHRTTRAPMHLRR